MPQILKFAKSLIVSAVVLGGVGLASPVLATSLNEARAQGLIGEQPNGLVAAISAAATPDIATLVAEINAARLNSYRQLAAKDGAPVEAVKAIAGEKLMGRARENGWYVLNSSGNWSR
ncbi:MAG: YdbL family protein [Rhodospirillaceae bacterium]|jgi:uncharacterized protein YdbL (DUF1318 family)|nr:YdbL family protein [Rhodospirillaceae bacterium]MBT5241416.1 YdbL family protein [Rhodospirillaceae bacterium]MBT5566608.1 YdbL family protein [Rhodospirillaceae bacterium]MBT6090697.1 YdbL family protein [Rhodospirillaceae bacterium]MBT7451827.1 YdbL family protein [Rhodospirillaceae bacterium]